MTVTRFPWQCDVVRDALAKDGRPALNVGANTDPGGVKGVDPGRVLNCDWWDHDPVLGVPTPQDRYFNVTEPWPFDDDYASIVLFGDIMEHIHEEQWPFVLGEARRVAPRVAITVPDDPRFLTEPADGKVAGSFHVTHVTEEFLRWQLADAGLVVEQWRDLGKADWWEDYFFVLATRGEA